MERPRIPSPQKECQNAPARTITGVLISKRDRHLSSNEQKPKPLSARPPTTFLFLLNMQLSNNRGTMTKNQTPHNHPTTDKIPRPDPKQTPQTKTKTSSI